MTDTPELSDALLEAAQGVVEYFGGSAIATVDRLRAALEAYNAQGGTEYAGEGDAEPEAATEAPEGTEEEEPPPRRTRRPTA